MPFHSLISSSRRYALPSALAATVCLVLVLSLRACVPSSVTAPSFASLEPWSFYGGEWTTENGTLEAMRNGRGDMAISRAHDYGNLRFSVQMRLRDIYAGTNYGDAGVLFRVSNPSLGVDSYNGYYGGLRVSDHSLILGRVRHEWTQLAHTPFPAPIMPGVWYTLALQAEGCRFTLSAAPTLGGPVTRLVYTDAHCPVTGSIGVRVYYARASWRDLKLTQR